jgi:site-specific DNA-cytosine methylase
LKRLPEEFRESILFNGMDMKSTGRQMLGRKEYEPSATVIADDYRRPSTIPCAFIMNEGNPNGNEKRKYREGDESTKTVTAGGMITRAFIVDGRNAGQEWGKLYRDDDEPAATVTVLNRPAHYPRAVANGLIVKMTVRALGRFQSFPDWYRFSGNTRLDSRIVGNAVPPLFTQRLGESLL